MHDHRREYLLHIDCTVILALEFVVVDREHWTRIGPQKRNRQVVDLRHVDCRLSPGFGFVVFTPVFLVLFFARLQVEHIGAAHLSWPAISGESGGTH